jgi:hypothetical protein
MKDLETISVFQALIEDVGEPPTTTFIYAMLFEMTRMAEFHERFNREPTETLRVYLYIADEYMSLRHFLFAKEHYSKVLALSENCPDFPDKTAIIEKCREQLRRIDSKEDSGFTENDPVEYTEKYLKILIELEAKIEEELKGELISEGFCHMYWSVKKKILKKDYGIRWESPSALNPDTHFD